ncbi:hypothetical protein MtrunA17_Chr2g0304971 [Medicago truncatula]|uniref:Uncharacterized protein n=1 Tax=Medicago truncatula TaxID=3880 RepID=A0A396JCH9_MEDTR|nr:hypothetical protein MtrunA17_Chr2g0304971 [Medicago truncatula]
MCGLRCELADITCHKLTTFGVSVRCLIAVALTTVSLSRLASIKGHVKMIVNKKEVQTSWRRVFTQLYDMFESKFSQMGFHIFIKYNVGGLQVSMWYSWVTFMVKEAKSPCNSNYCSEFS